MSRLLKSLPLLLMLLPSVVLAQDKPTAPPKPTPEVQKLIDEGQIAMKKYEWTPALQALEKAQEIAHKANDIIGEANALNEMGLAYDITGKPQKALELYPQALPLFRHAGNKSGEAGALANIAIIYKASGKPQKALELYQQALPLFKQIGSKKGEATVLNNIGNIYEGIDQPQQALEFFDRALSLRRQIGDRNGEASTLGNLGNHYEYFGQFQKALELYQRAWSLFKEIGNRGGEASSLTSIGFAYSRLGQPRKALDFYQQALPLHRQTGDKNGEADTLHYIGSSYLNIDQPIKALDFYQQALLFYKQTNNKSREARFFNDSAGIYVKIGQDRKALEFYQNALPLYKQIGDKGGEATTLSNIGEVYINVSEYSRAETFLQLALKLQEQLRRAISGSVQNRQEYMSSKLYTYRSLSFVQMKLKEYERAFATLNKMKGRSLLDQSMSGSNGLRNVPFEAKEQLRRLGHDVDKYSLNLIVLEHRNDKAFSDGQLQLVIAERALEIEQDALFARYPRASKTEAQPIALAEVPQFLPADTAILEYVALKFELGKKKTDAHLLFVVTVEQGKPVLTVHSLPVTKDEMVERADSLRDACADPEKHYKIAAKEMAVKLLPVDVLKRIAGKKRLVICPDGAVWNVPFAALVLPNGKHLIEQYELAYAYSASGAQAALNAKKGKGQGTLAVANPEFGDETRFGTPEPTLIVATIQGKSKPDKQRPLSDPSRGVFTQRGGIAPLPGTQLEADAISKLYPDASIVTGAKVQETELVKELPKYRYLHFATHGLVNDTAPLQSAIVLAQPVKGSEDDGFLTAREIMELKLNAEMVVLSACETARGVNKAGEGVVGLTWALFAAGCPTQVVSQWKISDDSTPKLMGHFYGNLKNGWKDSKGQTKPMGKGEALQKAAIAMMHDGAHSHPYHWASFVLFGDWR